MTNDNKIRLFLVDDDAVYLKLLEIEFLEHADFIVETFATGELCLAHLSHKPDIIILDYLLNGVDEMAMDGIQTLDRIKLFDRKIPVVMLSAQDKIDVAIDCMHHKAFDYVVKSETAFMRLQKIITRIFSYKKIEKELNWYMDRM
ncbi:MAG: response regulator [Bacteroidales bacterium]|jgi:DNA-binding NtrC family response regulator